MKKNTKKKSLFAASAMLAVAVVAATGATFAWFTGVGSASASISMGVEYSSSLEVSEDNTNWGSTVTKSFSEKWQDLSLNVSDKNAPTFYDATYVQDTTTINGYQVENNVRKLTIYFRSTQSENVIVSAGNITKSSEAYTAKENLLKWAQVVVDDQNASGCNTVVLANEANSATKAVTGTNTGSENGTYTASTFASSTAIVTLTEGTGDNAGYYLGQATFYFFIEGTEVDNRDIANVAEGNGLNVSLTFGQADAE